jgi:hypothetical protein
MPQERVLNLPLASDEIIEIILQRIEQRLRSGCYLSQAMTYNGFSFSFEGKLKFNDMMMGRDTAIWDVMQHGEKPEPAAETHAITEAYDSGNSPNKARVDHDLGLPIETYEGKRKVIRHRKIKDGEVA